MTTYSAPVDTRFAIGKCQDCGARTTYYRSGANSKTIRCPACREKAHKAQTRRSDERRYIPKEDSGGRSYTLIHDPRGAVRDEWGNAAPVFTVEEITACLPYGKYKGQQDYPFEPGCRFVGERGGLYGVYVTRDGRLIFGRVNQ